MVTYVTNWDMTQVADDNPDPAELAEIQEAVDRAWRRLFGEEPPAFVTTGLTPTWTREITRYDGSDPCPNCGATPHHACLVCSGTARDPRRWPMQRESEVVAPAGKRKKTKGEGKGSTGKPGKRVAAPLKGGLG